VSTPHLHLNTLFVLNDEGRIVSTREPGSNRGPLFALVRSTTDRAWAVHEDVPEDIACDIDRLARTEPPVADLRAAPVHADRYVSLLSRIDSLPTQTIRQEAGPAFEFPKAITQPSEIVIVDDERLLQHNFPGWVIGEIAAGRAPVMTICENGVPVSVCFSARSSDVAAEAGVETAMAFRGRGLAPRVTAAWALAIRASGRIPLYSTDWTNIASLAVARKLGLRAYASSWSLY
jgi:GNAT acetyltransferase-like protein